MSDSLKPINVGAPDPELKTSLILEETDEEFDHLSQEVDDLPVCYFNGVAYQDGQFVCSSSGEMLKCIKGTWLREGSCDPDNP